MPLPTLAATVTSAGISAPAIEDIIQSLIESLQAIYGSDIYLTPDTQDYQLIVVFATAINDENNTAIEIYNGFLPTFAQGSFLSALVKINGIAREAGTNATQPVAIGGVAGTVIPFGVVQDPNGNLWDLPESVTIPSGGTITVTATAEVQGSLPVIAGPVTIYTPVRGWQTASFTGSQTPGSAVESDASLRSRQAISTSLPSQTPLEAVLANVANVAGVTRYAIYENDSDSTDSNGLISHSIALVVLGGDATAIAEAIAAKKTPGTGTNGTTSIVVVDSNGVPNTIKFYILTLVPIFVVVNVTSLTGWVSSTAAAIQAAIAAFIGSLAIGSDVLYDWIFGPATLYGSGLEFTFKVTGLTIGLSFISQGTSDIDILFNQAASCIVADVQVNVT